MGKGRHEQGQENSVVQRAKMQMLEQSVVLQYLVSVIYVGSVSLVQL